MNIFKSVSGLILRQKCILRLSEICVQMPYHAESITTLLG